MRPGLLRGGAMGHGDRRAALLTPAQAARALHVAPRTVARWAAAGRILAVRTPGGHRRYREIDVRTLSERAGGRFDRRA